MAEGQSETGGTISADGKTMEFAYLGNRVKVTVTSEGATEYSCTIDGATIEAGTEAGLKAGLAAHAALMSATEGGELTQPEGGTGGNVLFTYKGSNMTIEVDSTGAVVKGGENLTAE
jgi:hypothetical protein